MRKAKADEPIAAMLRNGATEDTLEKRPVDPDHAGARAP
jgi:hypothetical protein